MTCSGVSLLRHLSRRQGALGIIDVRSESYAIAADQAEAIRQLRC